MSFSVIDTGFIGYLCHQTLRKAKMVPKLPKTQQKQTVASWFLKTFFEETETHAAESELDFLRVYM